MGPGCSAPYGVVTDDYASPVLLQKEWVSLLQGTDIIRKPASSYKPRKCQTVRRERHVSQLIKL